MELGPALVFIHCGDVLEKLGNIPKVFSSEFHSNAIKINKRESFICSSEDKLFSFSSKERIQTSSLLTDGESGKQIRNFEKKKF